MGCSAIKQPKGHLPPGQSPACPPERQSAGKGPDRRPEGQDCPTKAPLSGQNLPQPWPPCPSDNHRPSSRCSGSTRWRAGRRIPRGPASAPWRASWGPEAAGIRVARRNGVSNKRRPPGPGSSTTAACRHRRSPALWASARRTVWRSLQEHRGSLSSAAQGQRTFPRPRRGHRMITAMQGPR